jgi:hypothetical protein
MAHPLPTTTTIKELYGTASACAFPGCEQPLYRRSAGVAVRNSEVCHIHARSEGGPRWDPGQSAEENRSARNLLVFCFAHHAEVDDPRRLVDFPPELLRSWKARQIGVAAGHGYELTDEQASEVVAKSFTLHQAITLNADVIKLGGEGGRDGSGGGGGAAIGAGARGGPGGGTRFSLDGLPAAGYGGGGGGGGSMHLERREWPIDARHPSAAQKPDDTGFVKGVRLTGMFAADHVRRNATGLLDVRGGAWEWTSVAAVPVEIVVPVVCIFELREVEPQTRILMRVSVRDPQGACALEEEFLVDSAEARPVTMAQAILSLRFEARSVGIWTIAVAEGAQPLGRISLEVRVKTYGS